MPKKKTKAKKRSRKGASQLARTVSPEVKAAYAEIKQGVKDLERSITEVQRSLRKAERKIEAEARTRIRGLRSDARAQLDVLKATRREVTRSLQNLRAAAGDSWRDIKGSVDTILTEARSTATAVVERFRSALGS
jgi:chromosome segregation ATPase